MKIGVHCSVRKGFVSALEETSALGCDTLQIFSKSPRDWRTRVYTEDEFAAFRRERDRRGIGPVVVHTPYLPNLCTADRLLYERSLRALKEDLRRCEQLSAEYLVIHPGAYSEGETAEAGLARLVAGLDEALQVVPGRVQVLIENMAGGGRRIGGDFAEIANILGRVRSDRRLGVCFDTCHALGAGYDVRADPEGVLAEFDRKVGLDAIRVFHVNDSKAPLASHRDLHQHLGRGRIGLKALGQLLSRPEFRDRAFILETPKDSPEADPWNVARLRKLLYTFE